MIGWLLENTLWTLLLLPAVLLACRLLHASPGVRHLLWMALLVRLLAPSPALIEQATHQLKRWTKPAAAEAEPAAERMPIFFGVDPITERNDLLRRLELRVGAAPIERSLQVLTAIWCIGALFVLLREVRGGVAIRRVMKGGRSANRATRREVERLASTLGIDVPRITVSNDIAHPFVWGNVRQTLVLDAETNDGAESTVLLHELMHLKRRDPLWVRLELVARVTHWWNPLFRFVRSHVRRDAEIACDAAVVQSFPAARIVYARALVNAAERLAFRKVDIASLTGLGGDIERRIDAILAESPPTRNRLAIPMAATLLLATGGTLFSKALDVQPRFDPDEQRFLEEMGAKSWKQLLDDATRQALEDPTSPAGWRRLGMAYLRLGDTAEAERSFRHQLRFDENQAIPLYNIACVRARMGDIDGSFLYVEKAASIGGANPNLLRGDPDLAPLRADPRFDKLIERIVEQQANGMWKMMREAEPAAPKARAG